MTLSDFGTEIQNHGANLNDLVKDRGSWCHYWRDMTLQRGSASSAQSSRPSALPALANVPDDVAKSLAAQAKLVKSLQGQLDRMRSNGGGSSGGSGAVSPAPKPKAKAKGNGKGRGAKRRRVFHQQ